uniref:Uncharacterized protein n=1 Tax=Dunaliella tertiolecta TaxID=3047 RepID=A0A7S3QY89_DUNTE|mmetsp:Transcript_20132/g.56054  ORF Transcript_20132/g.56054 Transcript_20132/m.56054 type:complete len:510 (+) Transcript_20132:56-1585(+)
MVSQRHSGAPVEDQAKIAEERDQDRGLRRCCCSAECCAIAVFILLLIGTALFFLFEGITKDLTNVDLLARPTPWRIIHQQTKDHGPGSRRPNIRYGHTITSYHGQMIVTHGYFYNAAQNLATWLSDTWALDMKSYKWSLLSEGINQSRALQAYRQGHPTQPCGRFGHGIGIFNDTLYMYGGHDGGYSRTGQHNYAPEHDFDELWAFSFQEKRWTLLAAKPDPALLPIAANKDGSSSDNATTPGKRYLLASVVIDGVMIVYGGNKDGQGDVWALDLRQEGKVWRRLSPERPRDQGGPGRRVGAAIFPVNFPGAPRGFVLYGGRNAGKQGNEPVLLGDAWFFDLSTLKWRQLKMIGPAPSPRRYHGFTHMHIAVQEPGSSAVWRGRHSKASVFVGVIVGGSVDSPSHVCSGDSWAFTLDCGLESLTWIRLPDIPYAIYDMHAASHKQSVFSFGGHLCRDSRKDLPFSYTNQVWKLDVAPHIFPWLTQSSSCQFHSDETHLGHAFDPRGNEL